MPGPIPRLRGWPGGVRSQSEPPPPRLRRPRRPGSPAVASAKAGDREPVNPPAGLRTCRHAKRSKLSVEAAQGVTGDENLGTPSIREGLAMSRSPRTTLAVFGVLFGLSVWTWQPLGTNAGGSARAVHRAAVE